MNNLHTRALKAAERFVERRGYEVLDSNWSREGLAGRIDLVANDEGSIVFIAVSATDHSEDGFVESPISREQTEVLAANWLASNTPEGDVTVRFDAIDMIVVSPDRALLRHHINRYGSAEVTA